jgi:hypothetical protein
MTRFAPVSLTGALVVAQDSLPAVPHCGKCDRQEASDLVDTAVSAGNFETLAAALWAASLVETLKGNPSRSRRVAGRRRKDLRRRLRFRRFGDLPVSWEPAAVPPEPAERGR